MRLISVSGACSRSGKTALAETLLRALPGADAVKFTSTEDVFERCARGAPCTVCDIAVPFRLVHESAVLEEPGSDTARLAAAGARRVLWAIAKHSAVPAAWQAVERALARPFRGVAAGVVVLEGSTVVAQARPLLRFFVAHPWLSPERWKPTSAALVRDADAVVLNRAASETRAPAPAVRARLLEFRGRDDLLLADVTQPLAVWAPHLAARLERLARADGLAGEPPPLGGAG